MPETTEKYHHIPVIDKERFVDGSFRTIALSEERGIKAVIGKMKSDPNGPTKIQKYLFDVNKWTMEKAKGWVKENHKKALEFVVNVYEEVEKRMGWEWPEKGILDDNTMETLKGITDFDKEVENSYLFNWFEETETDTTKSMQIIKDDSGNETLVVKKDILIQKKDEMKRIVYGAVYEPMKADAHKHYATKEEIEISAHNFMLNSRNMDWNHDFIKGSAGVVESFVARKGDPDFVEGAWVLGVKIFNESVWEDILSKKIKGYSLAGVAKFGDVKEVPTDWEFDEEGRPKKPYN